MTIYEPHAKGWRCVTFGVLSLLTGHYAEGFGATKEEAYADALAQWGM